MTPLRTEMIKHLEMERLSPSTHDAYLRAVAGLAKHYWRSPDRITGQEVQDYLHHLLVERKLAWSSCNVAACGHLRRRTSAGKLESQRLLIPESFEVTDTQIEAVNSNATLIEKLGIELVPFAPRTMAIQAFPTLLAKAEPLEFIQDLLELLENKKDNYENLNTEADKAYYRTDKEANFGKEILYSAMCLMGHFTLRLMYATMVSFDQAGKMSITNIPSKKELTKSLKHFGLYSPTSDKNTPQNLDNLDQETFLKHVFGLFFLFLTINSNLNNVIFLTLIFFVCPSFRK